MDLNYSNYIDEWQLISGKDIKINDNIFIKHPKMKELFDIGEDNYYKAIGLFIATPYDYMVELYDSGILYTEINEWELFLNLFNAKTYRDNYKLIIGNYDFDVYKREEYDDMILYCSKYDFIIDELIYKKISLYLKIINNIPLKNQINPSKDKKYAKLLITELVKDERYKRKRRQNLQQNKRNILLDYVNKMVWGANKSYDEIFDMTLYQFKQGIKILNSQKNYNEIKLAYFTGNCDTKKININNYDWLNKSL